MSGDTIWHQSASPLQFKVDLLVEHRSLYATYGKVHGRFLDGQADKWVPICLDICDLYLVNFPICCSIPTFDPQLALDLAVGGDLGGGDEQEEQQARDGVGEEEQQVGDGEEDKQGQPGAGKEGQPSVQVVKHKIIQFNILS